MTAPDNGAAAADASWRRLSPRMLLIHPVNELLQFLPALLGVFLIGRAQENNLPWQIQAGFVVIPIVLGVARYFTTTYRVTPEQLQLRRGLLQRATLTAPIDRVRTVDATAPLLHRLLGLAKVKIGTGAGTPIELNGLPAGEAKRLRGELLHRAHVGSGDAGAIPGRGAGIGAQPGAGPYPETGSYPGTGDPQTDGLPVGRIQPGGFDAGGAQVGGLPAAAPPAAAPPVGGVSSWPAPGGIPQAAPRYAEPETLICSFRPSWVKYAPFTFSGWVAALAVWGFLSQFGSALTRRFAESDAGQSLEAHVLQAAWWLLAIEALMVLVVTITLLSVTSYVLANWGYRLTRHRGGTLHVNRGLLTTRAVSVEEARLRGVSMAEPLLLRLVGAARLEALLTGSAGMSGDSLGRAMLTPPAPTPEVRRVGGDVLRTSAPLTVPLTRHGPAARRRRYTRAVLSGLVIVAVVGVPAWWWGWFGWIQVASLVPLLASPLLGAERYRSLGHAVAGGYLVSRSGVLPRQTNVLLITGVIGWNVQASFFQRRVGLVTLVATTAAGDGSVELVDVPVASAYRLIGELTPQLTRSFPLARFDSGHQPVRALTVT